MNKIRNASVNKEIDGKYEKWTCVLTRENFYEMFFEYEGNKLLGINLRKTEDEKYCLTGWKNKGIKCYDTGRSVHYKGNCLAVLDDDNHFVFKTMKMCEKTADVYKLPAYHDQFLVTEPDMKLYERLDIDPVSFDCDTFQKDSDDVAAQIIYEKEKMEQSIIYTGPFRCVILSNGTMVRRGIPVSVSEKSISLLGEINCVLLGISAPPAHNYLDLYKKHGAIFLFDTRLAASTNFFPDIRSILKVSDILKERLLKMIDNKSDYFIIQGSDPDEVDSCCPNPLVAELKKLEAKGLISSYNSETSGSCPMTVYSFSGEIILKSDSFPTFVKNDFLRFSIRKYL